MSKLYKYIKTLTDEQREKALKLIETDAYADLLDHKSQEGDIHELSYIHYLKRKLTKEICQN